MFYSKWLPQIGAKVIFQVSSRKIWSFSPAKRILNCGNGFWAIQARGFHLKLAPISGRENRLLIFC